EFTLDGLPTREEKRALYLERFIHGAIYEARPDVIAVVHAHAEAVLPFTVTKTLLRPVIHSGSFMGAEVPVWDIADRFGDTNLLARDPARLGVLGAAGWLRRNAGLVVAGAFSEVAADSRSSRGRIRGPTAPARDASS